MSRQRKFIENILKKTEGLNEGILIPKEYELKIKNIDGFDFLTANELSKISENIFIEELGMNTDILIKNTYSVSLIKIDDKIKTIKFYPIALKKHLSKLK